MVRPGQPGRFLANRIYVMQDIFNPDFQIDGVYDADALATAERNARTRAGFDADEDCPYDRTLCRQTLVRMIAWKNAVEYCAANKLDRCFWTSIDMFYGCPVPQLNCIRRERYEKLLNRIQQNQR